MVFLLYLRLRTKLARERGVADPDVDFMLEIASHPYFDPETVAPRQVVENVRILAPYFKWDKPENHPFSVCDRIMPGYRAWCDTAREKTKLERWAKKEQREKEAQERRQQRWERQQALEAAREQSRALRDRERAVRIAWREQRLAEKQAKLGESAPESAARWAERQEIKKPSPFDP